MDCPICTRPVDSGVPVVICPSCHTSITAGISVGTTGEFKVPPPELLAALAQPGEKPAATNVCSWCGKLESQVKKLLGRSGTALCNECVALACDILDAELGTWR